MKNVKKVEKQVMRLIGKGYFKLYLGFLALIGFIIAECPMAAYAMPIKGVTIKGDDESDSVVNSVTAPMKTLIKVILGVMSVIGVFMLIKSLMDLITAIQDRDNSGMYSAGKGMAVSFLMIAITPVVNLFVDL